MEEVIITEPTDDILIETTKIEIYEEVKKKELKINKLPKKVKLPRQLLKQ
jgi:hypothetical protein